MDTPFSTRPNLEAMIVTSTEMDASKDTLEVTLLRMTNDCCSDAVHAGMLRTFTQNVY